MRRRRLDVRAALRPVRATLGAALRLAALCLLLLASSGVTWGLAHADLSRAAWAERVSRNRESWRGGLPAWALEMAGELGALVAGIAAPVLWGCARGLTAHGRSAQGVLAWLGAPAMGCAVLPAAAMTLHWSAERLGRQGGGWSLAREVSDWYGAWPAALAVLVMQAPLVLVGTVAARGIAPSRPRIARALRAARRRRERKGNAT